MILKLQESKLEKKKKILLGLGITPDHQKNPESIQLYEKTLALDPKNANDWFELGTICYDQNKYQKAIICNRMVLEIDSKNAPAWNNLGLINYLQDNFPKAIQCYERALELDPKNALAWNNLGLTYYEQENFSEAIRCYEKALELDPNFVIAWINLGLIFHKQEFFPEAIRCHKRTLALDPENVEAWHNLGATYYEQENFSKAIQCNEKALELDPNDGIAWNNLGLTYYEQDDFPEAIRCYKIALELDPNDITIKQYLIKIQKQSLSKDKETRKTAKKNRRKLEKKKKCVNRGDIFFNRENSHEAIYWYIQALEIDPKDADVWKKLGRGYFMDSNTSEARRCYEKAVEIDLNNLDAWCDLGYLYYMQSNDPEAIRCYEKALNLDPNNVEAWISLGIVFDEQKKIPEAIRCYEKALKLDPNNTKTKQYLVEIQKQGVSGDKKAQKTVKTQMDINIFREFEFMHGQIRFKISFINLTDTVITDVETHFKIPEALKWIGHEPDYKRIGNTIIIPKLNPDEKKVISLYFDPIQCMTGDIRATISYSDAHNQLHTTVMKDKSIQIICPIFFTPEDANSARVKHLYESLTNKDRKLLPLPSGELPEIFPILQSAISYHDIKLISKDLSLEEEIGELLYYGVTKVKQNPMIIKALLDGKHHVIELEIAGNQEDAITALLAEIQDQLRRSFTEHGLIANGAGFMEMKTSVILRICPYCGDAIPGEDQLKYKKGTEISCAWCKKVFVTY